MKYCLFACQVSVCVPWHLYIYIYIYIAVVAVAVAVSVGDLLEWMLIRVQLTYVTYKYIYIYIYMCVMSTSAARDLRIWLCLIRPSVDPSHTHRHTKWYRTLWIILLLASNILLNTHTHTQRYTVILLFNSSPIHIFCYSCTNLLLTSIWLLIIYIINIKPQYQQQFYNESCASYCVPFYLFVIVVVVVVTFVPIVCERITHIFHTYRVCFVYGIHSSNTKEYQQTSCQRKLLLLDDTHYQSRLHKHIDLYLSANISMYFFFIDKCYIYI